MSAPQDNDRVITVRQPWASALVTGAKAAEYRTWRPPFDVIGRRIWVHAGAAYRHLTQAEYAHLPRRCIVGSVVVVGSRAASPGELDELGASLLHPDRQVIAWTVADPVALPNPIPCTGRLGIWRWRQNTHADGRPADARE
jgi:hypothetical protein